MNDLKFNKTLTPGGLRIPAAVFRMGGFASNEETELRPIQDAVVVLKRRMIALELAGAVQSLHTLSAQLGTELVKACGLCKNCESGCPEDAPDQLLRQGISADTLEGLLEAGICLDRLARLTREDRVVYG